MSCWKSGVATPDRDGLHPVIRCQPPNRNDTFFSAGVPPRWDPPTIDLDLVGMCGSESWLIRGPKKTNLINTPFGAPSRPPEDESNSFRFLRATNQPGFRAEHLYHWPWPGSATRFSLGNWIKVNGRDARLWPETILTYAGAIQSSQHNTCRPSTRTDRMHPNLNTHWNYATCIQNPKHVWP